MKYDVIIIGGGIVGLSTAFHLIQKHGHLKIIILEKESQVAQHQTGHNSGVLHSGIYYKPGSLKALNCINGYNQLLAFCNENDIDYDVCGKVIVATEKKETLQLDTIYERGVANGLERIKKISADEIKEIEPHCAGIKGLFVPQTGIIDYKQVAKKYLELFIKQGGEINYSEKVKDIKKYNGAAIVRTNNSSYEAQLVINCAGLYSDKIAEHTNKKLGIKIIPFRGEYYYLKPEKEYLVNNLIYPVPNPDFPFLGVHFTRMIDGGIEAGPNAVLAFAREGYANNQVNLNEFFEIATFGGFHKIAKKYWREGWEEFKRSYSKKLFVLALQKLIPAIQEDDVIKGEAGVRAQACDKNGNLIDDFLILEEENLLHVLNSPSPAATASLSIGKTIVAKALRKNPF